MWRGLKSRWPLILAALVGLILVLSALGKDYLWADEGDTAVFAANITKYGVPKAWDGFTFVDSDKGARLNHDLILVTSPWLQYYIAAASFLAFGVHTFSARLPFAIAGWLTVLLACHLVLKATTNRWAAFSTAVILIGSVQFLLYCRQCRYYALTMLLTVLLLWVFLQMKSARQCALFAVIAVLLFHAHPIGPSPLFALAVLTIIYRPFSIQRRWFWTAAPGIIVLIVPWIFIARGGYSESMGKVESVSQFAGRIVQYLIECASVTPLLGVAAMSIFCILQNQRDAGRKTSPTSSIAKPILEDRGESIIAVTLITLLLNALSIAAIESTDSLWRIGIRYSTGIFPLLAISAGILIDKVGRGKPAVILSLTAIFVLTKFAQLTPWIFWSKQATSFDGKEIIEAHLPKSAAERFLNTRQQWAFISDLFQSNPGTIAKVSDFLRDRSQPGEKLITNYEWEPLYFHTGLPQALKILPDYTIYSAAKSKGLPDYVFDVDQVRWIVWRPVWNGYQGYFAGAVQQQIADRDGHIERVAQFPETLWENRENIHFRRFSGDRYLFHDPETFPSATIFRVEWPAQ